METLCAVLTFGPDAEVEFSFAIFVKNDCFAQTFKFLPVAEETGEPDSGVGQGGYDQSPPFDRTFQPGLRQWGTGENEHLHPPGVEAEIDLFCLACVSMGKGVIAVPFPVEGISELCCTTAVAACGKEYPVSAMVIFGGIDIGAACMDACDADTGKKFPEDFDKGHGRSRIIENGSDSVEKSVDIDHFSFSGISFDLT